MKILIGTLFTSLMITVVLTGYFFNTEKLEVPIPICSDTLIFLTLRHVDTVYKEIPQWEMDSAVQDQFLQASKYLKNYVEE